MSSKEENVINNKELLEFIEIFRRISSEDSDGLNGEEYEKFMSKFKNFNKDNFDQLIECLEKNDELDLLDDIYTNLFDFTNVSTGEFYQHLELKFKNAVEDAKTTDTDMVKIDAMIKLDSLMLFHSAARKHLDILRDIKVSFALQIVYLSKLIGAIKWAAFIIASAIIMTLITQVDREVFIKILKIISKIL
ncbi:MAG: hypothetical protein ABIH66_01470 [bacterium]